MLLLRLSLLSIRIAVKVKSARYEPLAFKPLLQSAIDALAVLRRRENPSTAFPEEEDM